MNKLNKQNRQKHKQIKSLIQSVLTALLLFHSITVSWAAKPAEKIFIQADHMQMNIKTGKSIYTGNVKFSQGKLILTGNKVMLEQTDGELQRLVVTGKPARYSLLDEAGETVEAESEHMIYTTSKNTLVMTINAHLKQPNHQLHSQKIIYDTKKKIVIAGDNSADSNNSGVTSNTGTQNKQRVSITLTPKKSKPVE